MRVEEKIDKLADAVGKLADQVAALERVNSLKLEADAGAIRFAEALKKCDAIAAIEDHDERCKAIARLSSNEDIKRVIGELDDEKLLRTLERSSASSRERIRALTPPHREVQIVAKQLPAPKRVRAKIAPDNFAPSVRTLPISGLTKAEFYPGWGLARGESWVELATTWEKRVAIDEHLRNLIETGAVVVEPVSEEESKRMLYAEILQLAPEDRPQLKFE